ncbi:MULTISPECIES: YfbR-like 5'-deoxynucleotidase [unclassified Methylophaga]|uniref:YfbR-like 5'-deoxynucleotidase n=1 Tax=unclassified Methylophaga TaxID=2629249 RepID=UPI0025D4B27E|nr:MULTISPECIES: YfbR-like 5'-deoxynucleotidase [unclassified Methylophaga]
MQTMPNNLKMQPSILLRNGKYFDFLRPQTSDFTILEIAHGLSNICRFAGQCKDFYSVAQHSVLVSRVVSPQFALQGLLHDAAEAFIGDIPTPLKQLLPDYCWLEKNIEQVIFSKFGLPNHLDHSVKQADLKLLATEQRDLMPAHDDVWPILKNIQPLRNTVFAVDSHTAREMFLWRYMEITGATGEIPSGVN